MIPLYTSIPAKMSRQTPDGGEIGHRYAADCIKSWHRCGLKTFTVNSKNESLSELIPGERVETIKVDSDAKKSTGKPLVFFSDFISAICGNSHGPVAIVNADIFLDARREALEQLAGLQPGECFVAKRIDIADPKSRSGREFCFGYDFFVYHSEDLKKLVHNDFVVGQPWWDHFLPIYMFLLGLRPLEVNGVTAYHLEHVERWEPDNWIGYGGKYIDAISQVLSEPQLTGPRVENFRDEFSRALTSEIHQTGTQTIEGVLKKLLRPKTTEKQFRLARIAEMNVNWIDEQRASPGAYMR